jgi:hypothetical protein
VSQNTVHTPVKVSGSALSQQNFLVEAAFVMPLIFSVRQALLNNFVLEQAAFTGATTGLLQSLHEVPEFLRPLYSLTQ